MGRVRTTRHGDSGGGEPREESRRRRGASGNATLRGGVGVIRDGGLSHATMDTSTPTIFSPTTRQDTQDFHHTLTTFTTLHHTSSRAITTRDSTIATFRLLTLIIPAHSRHLILKTTLHLHVCIPTTLFRYTTTSDISLRSLERPLPHLLPFHFSLSLYRGTIILVFIPSLFNGFAMINLCRFDPVGVLARESR